MASTEARLRHSLSTRSGADLGGREGRSHPQYAPWCSAEIVADGLVKLAQRFIVGSAATPLAVQGDDPLRTTSQVLSGGVPMPVASSQRRQAD
jgi:hypothetical protein